jgi:hypothetical protein
LLTIAFHPTLNKEKLSPSPLCILLLLICFPRKQIVRFWKVLKIELQEEGPLAISMVCELQ